IVADFARLHGPHLRPERGRGREAQFLFKTHLRNPEPEVAGARERRNANLRQRARFPRIEDRLLHPCGYGTRLPIDLYGSSANAKRAVVRARKEVHVDGAMRLATPDCRGILKLQTEDRLPDGGAAVACAGWSSHYRVIRTTVLFGVHEGIEQRHPGE